MHAGNLRLGPIVLQVVRNLLKVVGYSAFGYVALDLRQTVSALRTGLIENEDGTVRPLTEDDIPNLLVNLVNDVILAKGVRESLAHGEPQAKPSNRRSGRGSGAKILWGTWNDYPKVTLNGREYAQIGERLYSRHAVDRMQPSGMRYSGEGADGSTGGFPQIQQTGGKKYDAGRSVAPHYVEEAIATSRGMVQENGNIIITH